MKLLLRSLWVLLGIVFFIAAWRLYAIYRRRRRWKLLTTSHQSLHVARERIITRPHLSEEE
jgi:hypothetical protein